MRLISLGNAVLVLTLGFSQSAGAAVCSPKKLMCCLNGDGSCSASASLGHGNARFDLKQTGHSEILQEAQVKCAQGNNYMKLKSYFCAGKAAGQQTKLSMLVYDPDWDSVTLKQIPGPSDSCGGPGGVSSGGDTTLKKLICCLNGDGACSISAPLGNGTVGYNLMSTDLGMASNEAAARCAQGNNYMSLRSAFCAGKPTSQKTKLSMIIYDDNWGPLKEMAGASDSCGGPGGVSSH